MPKVVFMYEVRQIESDRLLVDRCPHAHSHSHTRRARTFSGTLLSITTADTTWTSTSTASSQYRCGESRTDWHKNHHPYRPYIFSHIFTLGRASTWTTSSHTSQHPFIPSTMLTSSPGLSGSMARTGSTGRRGMRGSINLHSGRVPPRQRAKCC